MSYQAYIEPMGYWSVDKDRILLETWLSYCEKDSEMELREEVFGVNPQTGEELRIAAPHSAFWKSSTTGEESFFFFSDGRIELSYIEEQIRKAKEIASSLGCIVVGEEGEEL